MLFGFVTVFSSRKEESYAAISPKYLLNGTVNTIAALPYGAGYNKTYKYSSSPGLQDYFTVELYSKTYSGSSTAEEECIFNFSYVYIVATIKQDKNPHNFNFPFGHKSFELKNNTTGSVVASGTLSGTGSQTLISRTLSDGYYTLKYVAAGSSRGTITDNFTFNFYIDGTAPVCVLEAGGKSISSGSYTNQLIRFSASDSHFGRIYYKKPGNSSYNSTTATSYTVEATPGNSGLWTFYAEDTVGNTSNRVTVCLDLEAPTGTLKAGGIEVPNGSYVNQDITFHPTDNFGLNRSEFKQPNKTNWQTYTLGMKITTTWAQGWYEFRAYDRAGQVTEIYSAYLDTERPTGILYAGGKEVPNGTVTNQSYIQFKASDSQSGIKSVLVKEPGSAEFKETANGSQFAVSGTYIFKCIDLASNVSEEYTITIDNTPPTLTCEGAQFGELTGKGFTVRVNKGTLYYRYEEESWKASGNSYQVPNNAKDGKYSFYAEDALGNRSSVYWVILTTEPPVGQLIQSTTDNGVYFTWENTYWTATLDGKSYTKGTWIRTEGEHVIILSNNVGLSATYTFSIGHNFLAGEVIAPTCTEQGYTIYYCTTCDTIRHDDFLDAIGHDFETKGTPATCTESSKTFYSCKVCGFEYWEEGNLPMGHVYVSEILKKASCTEDGERQFRCEKCGNEYTNIIPKTGHQYSMTETQQEGVTLRIYTCTVCGHSYTDNLGDPTGQVTNYVEYLFEQYSPYMVWVFLATAGVWSIVLGVMIIIAHKNEDKEKAKKMLVNYIIGLVVIFGILVAAPYLVRGIAALIG